MLDLSHPITQYRFRASGLMDGVMGRGQQMSVSPSSARLKLLDECLPLLTAMRELARKQFSAQAPFIVRAVDEYESGLRALASLGAGRIVDDRRDGAGTCPICGTEITSYPEYQLVLCGECTKPFMVAHSKLDSSEGFGTWAI